LKKISTEWITTNKTKEKYFFGKVKQAPPEINEGDERIHFKSVGNITE